MSESVRINKYLSEAGICSRREADRQIERGTVTINGKAAVMGDKVGPGDIVMYGKKKVSMEEEAVILAVNKPAGIVCTSEKREKDNIVDYVNYPKRVYPIGRLDKNSHGLILMTNQGEIANEIMRSRNFHEKEYIVKVNRDVTEEFLQKMSQGVYLEELKTVTRSCITEKVGRRAFRIILTQGLNRQIRRMCEAFHYRVIDLKRIRILNIRLGDLKEGTYRKITGQEWEELQEQLKG
ncbi:pseudouridine synthase [Petralouisia muris]|jgi:23S rRNA pseudouridine2604 synthase|uniref:Pseudouridine synthase n=1 Tax=Petralouisia muris TaxID=3032872 RepID=A0AC61RUX7_9FIRM|nr:pseudouridine synthase [Petralouisia muris]TGY95451.1 pseudouridine synthase [Petralouisia muris]